MQHFVYMWFDRSRKMFYVGSHSGSVDDGYISSSRWLSGEVRYRPADFKRRVIKFFDTKREAQIYEGYLLTLIQPLEFGTKYYNMKQGREKGCTAHNKGVPMSAEQKAKLSAARRGKPTTKGMSFPERSGINNVMNNPENKEKLSRRVTGRKMATRPDGTRYWTYPEKDAD